MLNVEIEWDRDSLGPVEPVLGPWSLLELRIVEMAASKMKMVKAAGTSGMVAEMLKAAGDVVVRLVTAVLNVIIRDGSVLDA